MDLFGIIQAFYAIPVTVVVPNSRRCLMPHYLPHLFQYPANHNTLARKAPAISQIMDEAEALRPLQWLDEEIISESL